jgi:hypothetical protein
MQGGLIMDRWGAAEQLQKIEEIAVLKLLELYIGGNHGLTKKKTFTFPYPQETFS